MGAGLNLSSFFVFSCEWWYLGYVMLASWACGPAGGLDRIRSDVADERKKRNLNAASPNMWTFSARHFNCCCFDAYFICLCCSWSLEFTSISPTPSVCHLPITTDRPLNSRFEASLQFPNYNTFRPKSQKTHWNKELSANETPPPFSFSFSTSTLPPQARVESRLAPFMTLLNDIRSSYRRITVCLFFVNERG